MKMTDPIIQATDDGKNFYLLFTITEFDGIPILFVAKDDYSDLYLCDCVEFREKQIWVISKITLNVLMQLIAQKITVLNALKKDKGTKILATFDYDTGKFTQENINFNEISPENLPEEGAFAYFNENQEEDNEYEMQSGMLYWNDVVNNAKLAVQDGHNLTQILSFLNEAVGTVKAAMA